MRTRLKGLSFTVAGINGISNVGDLVSVTGKVSEYAIDGFADRQQTDMKVTQINVRDDQGGNVTVLEKDVELPKPIILDEEKMSI